MMALKDPLLGSVLDGRYRIDSAVARGGMAMVYRGTDLRLDREIAIKVMHAHLTADDAFVERFEREAMNAARLSHPNLVAVHDQGRDGDVVYLVMEYLESVTLRKELKHRGRLTPRQAIVVMDSVLSALEAVHSAGIIHRDLKPDNVLLGTDGQIKLADFGLARSVSSATTTKTLIGTVGYVAPELVTRTGADARTDLYTLGIMFYEMLTGSQPYTDEVPIRVAYRHVHDDVPPPSESVPGLVPRLDAIVLWMTSRDPDARPASAGELRTALHEARSDIAEAQLDFGAEPGTGSASATPVLTATIIIEEDPPSSQPREPKARTDEIPYLAEDDATEDGFSAPAEAPRAQHVTGSAPKGDSGGAPENVAPATARTPRRRRRRVLAVGAGAVAAGLIAWSLLSGPDPYAQVPQAAAGMEVQDITTALSDAGLEPRTAEVFDSSVPAGKVIGTDPAAGTELARDSIVTIKVSKGAELFAAPNVTGQTEEQAREAVESAGLVLGEVTREHSDEVEDGAIISQSVSAGDRVEKGAAVDIVVSKGVAPVEVPIVTGLEYESAFGTLTRLGFLVAKEEAYDASVEKGRVISQWPRGRSEAAPGQLIILTVSKGPEPAGADAKDDAD